MSYKNKCGLNYLKIQRVNAFDFWSRDGWQENHHYPTNNSHQTEMSIMQFFVDYINQKITIQNYRKAMPASD